MATVNGKSNVCPVCGDEFPLDRSYAASFGTLTYFTCSADCRVEFAKSPEDYIESTAPTDTQA